MPYQNHYEKRKISDIDPNTDSRVRVMGFVVDKKEDTIVIDDGGGKVNVFMESGAIDKLEINQLVRLFGMIMPLENGFEIKADVVQDLSGLNINLYKKVDELYNRVM